MTKTQNNNSKSAKRVRQANVLEALKEVGNQSVKTFKNELLAETSKDFFRQISGIRPEKFSGEITPGETLKMDEVYTGKSEENKKLRGQIQHERTLHEEEKALLAQKSRDLQLQLHAISQEVVTLAQTTQGLGEQVEVAAMQVTANPGIYHIIFFEKLLEFIKSFRKKIETSSTWLNAANKRAVKKNYWGLYKKHGSKFLLSPDHYLQRSAG